jgi:hypothetical protein
MNVRGISRLKGSHDVTVKIRLKNGTRDEESQADKVLRGPTLMPDRKRIYSTHFGKRVRGKRIIYREHTLLALNARKKVELAQALRQIAGAEMDLVLADDVIVPVLL